MPWYVIQTYTGKEENLVEMIRRMVPKNCYGDCFVAYYEQLRCRHQENQIHVLRLFPSYVLISSDDIDCLFQYLKNIPAMSKIIATDIFMFSPLYEGEAEFLMAMMDDSHVVRLSYVSTDGRNHISYLSGPLEQCKMDIQAYQFRKRYALVRLRIAGIEKSVRMGIILNDDIRREMVYGKVEALIPTPDKYEIPNVKIQSGIFHAGDSVAVIEGAFEGNIAVVNQVKQGALRISVHLFGREISAEVPVGSVRKIA